MRNRRCSGAMILFVSLLLPTIARGQEQPSTSQPSAEALAKHLEEMEREIKELRAQVKVLTGEKAAAETAPAASGASSAVVQNSLVSGTQPAAAPSATPSLASILGPTTLSGFVDVYYGQNFNNPESQNNGLRYFDQGANQFGLNLMELVIDKTPDPSNSRTGYHVALGYGQAMNAVNASEPKAGLGFDQYLKEAYFSYLAPVGKGLQFDVGKFVTPAGAEVIETKDNWNYSRGVLFSYAIPYFHFGMRTKYTFNDKYALTGFFINGWNNVVDNNTGKTYGVNFAWNPNKKFGIAQTYMAGPEENGLNHNVRQLSDTVFTYTPTARLSFMLNGDYGRGDRYVTDTEANTFSHAVHWTGVAGYAKYALAQNMAIAGRYEYYDDADGYTLGTLTTTHVNEFTATFERIIGHHIISRFEFRRDMSNQPLFYKGSNPVTDQNTLTAGLVMTFNSGEGGK
ncbi:hypothetical protein Acid345_4447 [Candidatus Koribacter versatilis Ellin345]|uniref:Porin n=2 Tax=Candidatus Korobacter versatilis TaxID=658062 RepID=Q1II53_KORVE|nr:hypothetical protein Acid345_4447 [Candidatus Koribacter versatilis Ellin345]